MAVHLQEKVWYVDFWGEVEGPFSVEDLRNDVRISPETLVWRAGFKNWRMIKEVPELKEVFHDENRGDEEEQAGLLSIPDEEVALNLERGMPPNIIFWIVVAVFIGLYYLARIMMQ